MTDDPRVGAVADVLLKIWNISAATAIDIAAHILAAADRAAWRPIETAPTNESILIYIPNAEHYGPGIYRAIYVDMGTGKHWHAAAVAMGRDLKPVDYPTHWQPLPSPPETMP